ncbi:MAG: Lcl domain-containing protein [Salinarimonas sp.]
MLRNSFILGLVLLISPSSIQIAAAQQRPDWIGQGLPQTLVVCTATGTTANLRSGTDTDSPVEARLQNGAHVVVMREMQFPDRWSWFHVRHVVPGRPELRPAGWMHGSLIQRNCSVPHDAVAAGSRGSVVGGLDLGPPPRGLRAAAPVSLIPVEVCVQTGDTLNLRSGPGTGSPVLASLENGTPLVILTGDAEATGPWLRVRLGDPAQVFHLGRQVEGYVFNRYVLDDYCQTQHNPLVAGSRGSRLDGRDVTLGAWATDHDMHVWNPSHPQSRRVLGVGLPAHRAYLADLGISEDPYPEDTAAIAAQAAPPMNSRDATGTGILTGTGGGTGTTQTATRSVPPASSAAAQSAEPEWAVLSNGRRVLVNAGGGSYFANNECAAARRNTAQPLATPISDFVDNADGTVTHRRTGLTWYRCPLGFYFEGNPKNGYPHCETDIWGGRGQSDRGVSYDEATEWAAAMRVGGRRWRLPTVDELVTIIEPGCHGFMINHAVFPAFQGSHYWTSDPPPSYMGPANRAATIVSIAEGRTAVSGGEFRSVRHSAWVVSD